MFKKLIAITAALAVTAMALAQSKPSITVSARTGSYYTAGTNATPTLVTTNTYAGLTRAWITVQNTNTVATVVVYAGTTKAAPQAILSPGQVWTLSWPTVDNGKYSVGSTSDPVDVFVAEGWGE